MGKRKSHSEVEYLRGLNRRIDKENKHLKKQLARADKAVNTLYNLADPDLVIEQEEPAPEDRCPLCKARLSAIDFGIKTVISCKSCSYRNTVKN